MSAVPFGDTLKGVNIAGVSLLGILGVILTISIVRYNMLTSQLTRVQLKKYADEGYTDDSVLDKIFGNIQEKSKKQT